MTNPAVIVVPETEDFWFDVTFNLVVWINKELGVPELESRNARYLAPYWINGDREGVDRIYHIREVIDEPKATTIRLGNSFVLDQPWRKICQKRRFEYWNLARDFGFAEIRPGLIRPL